MKKFLFLVVVMVSSFAFANQTNPLVDVILIDSLATKNTEFTPSNVVLTENEQKFFQSMKLQVKGDLFETYSDGETSFEVSILSDIYVKNDRLIRCFGRVEDIQHNSGAVAVTPNCNDLAVSAWTNTNNSNQKKEYISHVDFFRPDSTKIYSTTRVLSAQYNQEYFVVEGSVVIGDHKICDIAPTPVSLIGGDVELENLCDRYKVTIHSNYSHCSGSGGRIKFDFSLLNPETDAAEIRVKKIIEDHCTSQPLH